MLDVLEPATGAVLESIPRAGVEETDAAVARAKAAGPAWRAVAPPDRARLLGRIAAAVEDRLEELSVLEARNAGKPIGDARGEIGMVVDTFRYYAGAPERLLGDTIPVAGGVAMTFREPLGVVALITPWNFPLCIAGWKLAPGAGGGEHRRPQARGADAADRARVRDASPSRRGCPKASSTSSPGRARRAGSASSSTPTSPRSRSPARRRSAGGSPRARRRRSSA